MAVSQERAQTAGQRFEHEFVQWFRWANFVVFADNNELNDRLEILSRLAVWVVFDWMLHSPEVLSEEHCAHTFSPVVQQVLNQTQFLSSDIEGILNLLFWPIEGQPQSPSHRCLREIVSRYATTIDESTTCGTSLSPAIFSVVLNGLLSTPLNTTHQSLQKQNGCFDTPHPVAVEMVLDALETFLADKTPSVQQLHTVLRAKLPLSELPLNTRYSLVEAIAQLKVIDPACGAGIFPLQMASELEQVLVQLDPDNELLLSMSTSDVDVVNRPEMPVALWRRWFILRRCIYAIDVQPLAVEITRIRCFFWLLAAVEHQQSWITPLLDEVFSDKLHIVEADTLTTHSSTQFGVTGFDVAIANPPYIDSEAMVKHQPALRKQYAASFQSAKGNWDLFVVFIEWGLRSLAPNGVLTYIVPNKLVSAPYATALRRVLRNYNVTQIQDFSRVSLFRDAKVYPVVVTAQRRTPQTPVTVTVMQSLTEVATTNIVTANQFYHDTDWSRHFAPANLQPLLDRCNSFPAIEQWFPAIAPAMTVREAYALQPMLRDAPSDTPHKKLVNTGTIDRYRMLWGDRPTRYLKQRYQTPIIHDADLHRLNPIRLRQASATKLIIGGMTRQLECCYDKGHCLAGKSTTIILSGMFDLYYALALLNSPLVSIWYRHTYGALALSGGYLRISHRELKTIPMPVPTPQQERLIVDCVDQLINVQAPQRFNIENQLNILIYQLYGLTDHEVESIESMQNLSK